jgi:hypothetical protein
VRIRLNYEVKEIFLTYTGVGDRADAEESRPVRGEASLSAFLQQFILKGQLARNGSWCRSGSPDAKPAHSGTSHRRRDGNRLRYQVRNTRRRQLHRK